MSDWTEQPESIVLDVEPPPQPRKRVSVVGSSFAIHAVLLVLLIVSQATSQKKPEKNEPVLPLLFEEPVQPRIREPLDLQAPRVRPHPIPRAPELAPAPVQPAPPAVTQPAPPPPPPPEDKPLLGWGTKGAPKGHNDKPPGPEASTLGPGAPGPKGKGMQDAEQNNVPEPQKVPDSAPPNPGGEEKRPGQEQNPLDRDPSLFPPPPMPPPSDAGPRGGSGQRPVYRNPIGSRSGRVGERGTGFDPNVGMNGGFFGDVHWDDGNDYKYQDYTTKMYFLVRNAWIRELYARVERFGRDQAMDHLPNLDGRVTIHLFINRDGRIDGIEVLSPSVMATLDEASKAALRRVVLPPLPSDFPKDREGLAFRFEMTGFPSVAPLRYQLEAEVARLSSE